jgi:hypothetical protein
VSIRTVDWLRDHGFESAVNNIEQWYYTRHKPTGTVPSRSDLPTGSVAKASGGTSAEASAKAPATTTTLAGGGTWQDVGGLAVAPSGAQEAAVVPDPRYPSVGVALVRLDQQQVRTVYVPGLQEPGGRFSWGGGIPVAARPRLVAAFNAGFKMRHITGGVWTEGRSAGHLLQAGQASVVIYRDGHTAIAKWGRDASLTPDVVSVRQNLSLIVDGGRAARDLVTDRTHKWGTYNSQLQFTWRSGIGIDPQGRLIYAAGRQMSITELATALIDGGAVRAMQLDIHDNVVTFNWFHHHGAATSGSRLMTSMTRPADRFLFPDWRDFFAIEAR